MTGRLIASTLRVWKPGFDAWSAMSVFSSMPAPASSTNDAAICVTAKARSRRLVDPVIRTPRPASPCGESAEGSRGTNARRTDATSASATPTQRTLTSSVRSSARAEKRDA